MDNNYYDNNYNNGYDNNTPMTQPDNYLVWAILVTVGCCWPLGIPAILNSTKVDKLWNQGDYMGAQEASNKAKKFCIYSAIAAGVFWILYFILIVILAAAGAMDY